MSVATIQCLNYDEQESKKHNLQFVSNKTVTLKTSDNVDPEPGYEHAKFERFRFNGVREKSQR